jgi:hypothetical protein
MTKTFDFNQLFEFKKIKTYSGCFDIRQNLNPLFNTTKII